MHVQTAPWYSKKRKSILHIAALLMMRSSQPKRLNIILKMDNVEYTPTPLKRRKDKALNVLFGGPKYVRILRTPCIALAFTRRKRA